MTGLGGVQGTLPFAGLTGTPAPRPTRRLTHDELVLLVLRETNGWVSSADLYRRTHSIVHSRVASLRRKGYVVEHKGGGQGPENHFYRLAA